MISDLWGCALILLSYYLVILAAVPVLLKTKLKVPNEYVRKLQHVGYSLSVFLLLELFSTWYMAIAAICLLVTLAYPFLMLTEKLPLYKRFFVDRSKTGGEYRKQLIFAQLSFALLIIIYWGLLGVKWHYVIAVAVMAWGFGDAAAALVGKAIGRRHILHHWIERAKTCEGTTAMILVAGLAVFLTLFWYAGKPWLPSMLISIVVAPLCGVIELFSRQGSDTITVPLFTAAIIFPLSFLFSFFGW
jgi:phytol kinase